MTLRQVPVNLNSLSNQKVPNPATTKMALDPTTDTTRTVAVEAVVAVEAEEAKVDAARNAAPRKPGAQTFRRRRMPLRNSDTIIRTIISPNDYPTLSNIKMALGVQTPIGY